VDRETFCASPMSASHARTRYELRFQPLTKEGCECAFPCDASGQVDMDALTARARNNYFYARTCIGREFTLPAVQRAVDGLPQARRGNM